MDADLGIPGPPLDDEPGIRGQIARLARALHGAPRRTATPAEVLGEVTKSATELIPGVAHAGITLARGNPRTGRPVELESTAATGPIPETVDRLQHEHGEGPCFNAIWDNTTVLVDDMTRDERWPTFLTAVRHHTPVRSSLSIELYTTDQELGALNLYAETTGAFTRDSVTLALNLATHAAIALSSARREEQFDSALASRDIIGQAKGMIMERYNLDAIQAFELLKKLSQDSNVRLADIATQLVQADHPTTH